MKKILAIDDQKDNLITIQAVIKNNIPDSKIFLAESGKVGIELAVKEQPDAILLDIIMPEMDGFEVCEKLKTNSDTKHIPVLMLTAIKTDAASRAKGLNSGADAFLAKPIEAMELTAQINVMFRIKEAEDKLRAENEYLEELVAKRTKEVKESEKKYKALYYDAPLPYQSLNEKGEIEVVNQAWLNLLGYKKEEVIGKGFGSLLHPDFVDVFKSKFLEFKQSGMVDDAFFKIRDKKGHFLDILLKGRIGYQQDGKIKQTYCVFQDITEKNKIEKALKQSEEKFRKAFETSPDSVNINRFDDGTYVSVNDGFTQIMEYESGEVIGKTSVELGIWVNKDDRKQFVQLLNDKGKVEGFETKFRTKSAKVIDGIVSAAIINLEGVPHIINISRDVTQQIIADTALKKSEERFRFLAKNSIDCIWTLDRNLKFTYLSPALEKITGYKVEEWLGTKLRSHFSEEEYKKASEYTSKAIRSKKRFSSIYFESKVLNKKGEEIYVEFSGSLMLDNDLNLQGFQGTMRDITVRVRVREALIESERKFKDLANLLPQIIYESDLEGNLTYINKLGLETFGYNEKDVRDGINILQGIAPEDKARAKLKIQNILTHDAIENTEYSAIRKNGEKFPILIYSSPIFEKGKVAGIRGVMVDISQRKEREKNLKENEEKLRLIFNNSPVGISITDLDGKFIDTNPFLSKITGYSREDMLGTHFNVVSHPEDKELNQQKFDELVSGKISFFDLENRYIHKNGNIIYVLIRSQLINDHSGKPMFQTLIIEDITERKKAERVRSVLYNISNAAVNSSELEKLFKLIRSELGTIIDTTNFFVALYDKSSEKISLPFFIDEKDEYSYIPQGKSLTRYVIDTRKPLLADNGVVEKLISEGKLEQMGSSSKVWLGVPLKSDGKITGVLVVQSYKDENAFNESDLKMLEFVSEQIGNSIQRVKAETDLKAALKKANESDQLKSSFLAIMSHELRTPLNAIIGFSEFFDRNLPPEDVETFGKIIKTSGNHLLSIVNDLFDITLIESGKTKLKKEDSSLESIILDVYDVANNLTSKESKDVKIELAAQDKPGDVVVNTDVNKVKQILINLLKNAYKFTDQGYIRYGYQLKEENNKSFVLFFVEDSGIGISRDNQEVIFDVFRQVEDTSTRKYGGAGIGLSVAKRLTEILGGKIWLESEKGKGSKFYFTIPYEKKKKVVKESISNQNYFEGVKDIGVLVVEDDESSFYYLKTLLEKAGMVVIHAGDGQEAIDISLSNSLVKIVLMDINLPVMNGYEATKIIKSHLPEIPIIAQTAYAVAGDREKALESGCDDYLPKPIQPQVLWQKIKKFLID